MDENYPSNRVLIPRKITGPVPLPTRNPARETGPAQVAIIEAIGDASPATQAGVPDDIDLVSTASTRDGEWVIQVGSMPDQEAAREALSRAARKAPRLLADAAAFTESFTKDGRVYFRARYAGFDAKSEARKACGVLKRKNMDCYALLQ